MARPNAIHLYAHPSNPCRGVLTIGALSLPCALGRSGRVSRKREGDGATPRNVLRPIKVYYRADQWPDRAFALPHKVIRQNDGWCDDVASPRYNRLISLPSPLSHERLWRDDAVYDVVIETDWNHKPAIRGLGSAIFIHLARPGFKPTEGCIALDKKSMNLLLPKLNHSTRFIVH